MTGDYLSWDPAAQGEVVRALAGLRAPYGGIRLPREPRVDHRNGRNPSPGCSLRKGIRIPASGGARPSDWAGATLKSDRR